MTRDEVEECDGLFSGLGRSFQGKLESRVCHNIIGRHRKCCCIWDSLRRSCFGCRARVDLTLPLITPYSVPGLAP